VTPAGADAAGAGAPDPLAAEIIGLLTARGETVAAAESLTGGLVTAALTSVPGSSAAVLGGIVSYATSLKAELLGVPAELLAAQGPVDPEVAAAMAEGVRGRLGASYGLATTGVAGPGPADGKPAGTVFVAVAGPAGRGGGGRARVSGLELPGGRAAVRAATVQAVLTLLVTELREDIS
jgi:nicotinamide-nucleotide amidase